jgi:alcohol dehydrogenase class IV
MTTESYRLSNRELDTSSWSTSRLPKVVFGNGAISTLTDNILEFGRRVLIISGRSFMTSQQWDSLKKDMTSIGVVWSLEQVCGEPRVDTIDQIVARHIHRGHDVVVGIGGGSALDTAKAIAGLLLIGRPMLNYIEGVGPGLPYPGPSLPLIAVPTTAGTGSEMTQNAVISGNDEKSFKKSFRDERLTARVALIDPQLLAGCPPSVKAANAMDTFTQLMESYVALGARPKSDAVAIQGIEQFLGGFSIAKEADLQGNEQLAYASMMSGISLAQAGLGVVHGLASPLGAHFPIPHGVACGALLAVATAVNIRALSQRDPNSAALKKYAHVGELVAGIPHTEFASSLHLLQEALWRWTSQLKIGRLSDYGIKESDIPLIVSESRAGSMLKNPLVLTDAELEEILHRCL